MSDLGAVDAVYREFERHRWGEAPRCPHCDAESVGFLRPTARHRHTRTGAATARRVWKCATCHRQFSVLTGTVLHGTRIDLSTWLAVLAILAVEGAVPAPARIVAEHGISRDAARHLHAILVRCCAVDEVAACLPVAEVQRERQGSARFSGV